MPDNRIIMSKVLDSKPLSLMYATPYIGCGVGLHRKNKCRRKKTRKIKQEKKVEKKKLFGRLFCLGVNAPGSVDSAQPSVNADSCFDCKSFT
jgi:hypothetical protein